ncbi:MAG: phosphomannomutase/phosphoglucomutase [Anaerolineae bacterium]
MSIYKACDIRGVYGTELDAGTALALGRAVGTRFKGRLVAVGGDLRPSTPVLRDSLIQGLLRSGANVVNLGLVPTPVFYFGKDECQAQAGIMVTASHNPTQYNGFKVILGDLPVLPEDLQALAREIEAERFSSGQGSYHQQTVNDAYVESIESAFQGLSKRRIVVDAGNGSFWQLAPRILSELGQEVVPLFCTPDGNFPNRNPNPSSSESLGTLQALVRSQHADLGIAFDGDGDRVVFVDDTAQVLPADRILVLFIRSLLRKNLGARVVYDLKSSSIVADEVKAAGGSAIMERSGHAFIKRRLMTEGALLGGEVSGHYFFGALNRDDALYATLLLLQVLDELHLKLSEAIATIPAYPITPDIRLACSPEKANKIIAQVVEAFSSYPLDRTDGVRVLFPTGWVLVRVSVTEPLITLRFEARTENELSDLQDRVRLASPLLAEIWPTAAA